MAERTTGRRAKRPGAPGADPTPQSGAAGPGTRGTRGGADAPVRASEDTDRAWGDGADSNDERLRRDIPPHWGGKE
ncbi:MAG: hypothetical protein ACTHON_09875 [Humibacter sp.]